jgi:hypothetical protein
VEIRKIHRRSAGDKAARIGFFPIKGNQFPGASTAILNHAANTREGSFGEGVKSSTRGRVRSFQSPPFTRALHRVQ